MAKDTHVTAPTRFVEANGIRYACSGRRNPPINGVKVGLAHAFPKLRGFPPPATGQF
jgi:hypothetical protein